MKVLILESYELIAMNFVLQVRKSYEYACFFKLCVEQLGNPTTDILKAY
jgi:hypothetical protein